jgi:CheY-like chemotaxis protein
MARGLTVGDERASDTLRRQTVTALDRFSEYDPTHAVFRDLIGYRVRELLLVSSRYDSYILEEDGQLAESLDAEFYQLNLASSPRITQASSADEALTMLGHRSFDMVITMARLGAMDPRRFARTVKATHPELPVVLLADNHFEAHRIKESGEPVFDQVFVWRGNVTLFLAIIKLIEDLRNVAQDTELAGVRTIILIENSVRFYSSYLPLLYAELTKQTHALMADGVNPRQRLRRMKARAKILLAETFEEGWSLFEKYHPFTLGVISDARFPHGGHSDPGAGLEFARRVKAADADMPVLIQSTDAALAERAYALGASFLDKRSPRLLEELRHFMQANLGFGDFVFVDPRVGREVARVPDLAGMPRVLQTVPGESLRYHASRNHFSNWCMARTEFALAARIRPRKVSDFASDEELRSYLVDAFSTLRSESRRGVVADFSRLEFDELAGLVRIGAGSMGGKGRGLGFVNALLARRNDPAGAADVRVFVPPTAVIGTDVFDEFLQEADLSTLALSDARDEEIEATFLAARLPRSLEEDLRAFVAQTHYPVAVRSSSLLEDSYDLPFAGIYKTFMLSNAASDSEVRLAEVAAAVKLVYASTFSRNAKAYLANTPHRAEEEKMAVVLQRLVGRRHERYFYPDFAGVACSHNYYPVLGMTPETGLATVALGFGKTVVEGGKAMRFSPGSPRIVPQFASTAGTLKTAQTEFFALDLERGGFPPPDHSDALVRLGLERAEQDGTLHALGSVYSRDNDVVYDGLARPGIRLVTFAPILKLGFFPLADVLAHLLALGEQAMSCPVEMEFAVNLPGRGEHGGDFAVLQLRPLVVEVGSEDIDEILSGAEADAVLCRSDQALGQGRVHRLADVVYVMPGAFERLHSPVVVQEVEALNRALVAQNRPYLLIGPGRWGTSDRFLGIPVEWWQIAGARVIVETELDDVPVTPSEGTHFFQNITSFGIGYLTVSRDAARGFVDFDWLGAQPALAETRCLRHVRLDQPLDVRIDGRSQRAVILKRRHAR